MKTRDLHLDECACFRQINACMTAWRSPELQAQRGSGLEEFIFFTFLQCHCGGATNITGYSRHIIATTFDLTIVGVGHQQLLRANRMLKAGQVWRFVQCIQMADGPRKDFGPHRTCRFCEWEPCGVCRAVTVCGTIPDTPDKSLEEL